MTIHVISTKSPTSTKSSTKHCNECGTSPATKLCSGCESTHYCSKECQRKNWSSHKATCIRIRTRLRAKHTTLRVEEVLASDYLRPLFERHKESTAKSGYPISDAEALEMLSAEIAPMRPGHIRPGEYTPLVDAACRGHVGEVRRLLAAGEEVDQRDGVQGTALHAAAANARYKVCKVLLEAGADVNAVTPANTTPLEAFAQNAQRMGKRKSDVKKVEKVSEQRGG